MAKNEGFRSQPEWKKFWKPLAWYTFAAIALVGLAANASTWVHIKGPIPPVITTAPTAA